MSSNDIGSLINHTKIKIGLRESCTCKSANLEGSGSAKSPYLHPDTDTGGSGLGTRLLAF